ncbi:hypothetical protein SmJEL517_g04428 [Synchytrium microbalum]|uniref:Terpene cyclase/mutase family member n=1 Tax=Synchytrium microbalum TaxID=1806994 RepID=A0A507C4P7_9FUNG|nr:uncharacterized protein SmJEL517_g04428 [Synchytrium microbalum]TPX32405.1 hypothetical protein SmJEL517_g04428 [Synchytrium microbalum]
MAPDTLIPVDATQFSTDATRWRLHVKEGAQVWEYLDDDKLRTRTPQATYDKYWLGILKDMPTLSKATSARDAARNGFNFAKELQTPDGHWAGEYGGPMFLIPGLTIVMYITGTPYPPGYQQELIRYLFNRANKEDGGWGIHIEGISTVFGTSLNYVALRLLGVDANHPVCVKARDTLHKLGGSAAIPAWGKFWLSVLGCYDWAGNNPVPPELWILPQALPFHPGNMWCHSRMVALPMSWLYGKRYVGPITDLVKELRQELYTLRYETIDWPRQRNNVAKVDLYQAHTYVFDFLNVFLGIYEKFPIESFRKAGLDAALHQIRTEDENTLFLDLGPVNKVMNMLITFIEDGPTSVSFHKHVDRIADFMWIGGEGMMMNGTNGSQLWDTAFMMQALVESGLAESEPAFKEHVLKALEFLDVTQIKKSAKNHKSCFRFPAEGSFPFSTRDQSYTVFDCTAEGLKAAIYLQKRVTYVPQRLNEARIFKAADVLLAGQNYDGGFPSYEPARAHPWIEWLNPAEVFGNIMIDYSYPECTTACVLSLTTFRKHYPNYRSKDIEKVVKRAIKYIKNAQRPDGSWYGSWGVCFTYATWFGIETLASVGEYYDNSPYVKRACDFLISKQQSDGGWGESYKSCEQCIYIQHEKSQVTNTSWAVMSLIQARYPFEEPIRRGVQVIMSRQQANGEWLQEGIEGAFNKNVMISYPNYKFSFTIWALGRYANAYGNPTLPLPKDAPIPVRVDKHPYPPKKTVRDDDQEPSKLNKIMAAL